MDTAEESRRVSTYASVRGPSRPAPGYYAGVDSSDTALTVQSVRSDRNVARDPSVMGKARIYKGRVPINCARFR